MNTPKPSRAKFWLFITLASILSFLIALLLVAYLLLRFIFGGDDLSDCSFSARDQVTLIAQKEIKGASYFVYSRLSGFQEKIRIIEVYEHQPAFDDCMRADDRPLVAESLLDLSDQPQGYICPLALVPGDSMFKESGSSELCIFINSKNIDLEL